MKELLTLILLTFVTTINSQVDIDTIPTVDSMWQDYISSVQFYNSKDEQSLPILPLNGGTFTVRFDDSYGEFIDYYYTIKHCDKDWNYTENIEVSEYLEGPEELEIETFANSVLTFKKYTHYQFTFPNQDIRLRWSGNYMLIIYDADGTVAITRRFYIYENNVDITIDQVNPNGNAEYSTHQAFMPKINITNLDAKNTLEELYLTGFQNRFNENPTKHIQPFLVDNKYATFNFTNQLAFLGLKEYRFFDTRGITTAGLNVDHIDVSDHEATVYLYPDKNRSDKANFDRNEANGAFVIRNDDRRTMDYNITAEYPTIAFNLLSVFPLYGDIYLMGEFNDFKIDYRYKMTYSDVIKGYLLEVPLKQGYYNYLYALKRENEPLDYLPTEGSSYETENMYHFFVYQRPFGARYDRLIGYRTYQTNNF